MRTRADKAEEHSAQVEAAEDNLRLRTEGEIDARLSLEKQIWRGPRDVLIRFSEALLKEKLARFKGQRFRVSVCQPGEAMVDRYSELEVTAEALRIILSKVGWQDDMWPGNAPQQPSSYVIRTAMCTNVPGIYTGVSQDATQATLTASRALQGLINGILNQNISLGTFSTFGADASRSRNPLHSDEIDIEVDPHPAFPGDPKRTTP